jgi:hypothetical protein
MVAEENKSARGVAARRVTKLRNLGFEADLGSNGITIG